MITANTVLRKDIAVTAGNTSAKRAWKPKVKTPKRHLAAVADNLPSWRTPRRWNQDDLFVPKLKFTPYAWSKLLFLRDLGDTEVGGFGISSEHDLFLIEDVRLVRQNCTAMSVAFEDEAVADFFDDQIDQDRQPEHFGRHWIHTHPGNRAEPSSTDEETFARVFDSAAWSVMFILAQGGETSARLKFGCGPARSFSCQSPLNGMHPFLRQTMRLGNRSTSIAFGPCLLAPHRINFPRRTGHSLRRIPTSLMSLDSLFWITTILASNT